jgi:hypothetical protein
MSITWYWNIEWNSAEILVKKNHPNFKLNYDICIYKWSIKSGSGYNKPHLCCQDIIYKYDHFKSVPIWTKFVG